MSCIYFMFQYLQVGTGRLKSKQVWLGNMLAIVASPLKSRGLTRRATRSVPQCLRRRVLRGFFGACVPRRMDSVQNMHWHIAQRPFFFETWLLGLRVVTLLAIVAMVRRHVVVSTCLILD
jgi:hypothetical protein